MARKSRNKSGRKLSSRQREKRRLSPKERRLAERKHNLRKAAAIIGTVFVLASAIVWVGLSNPELKVKADTLCRADNVLSSHTIVLIDATDKLPNPDIEYLRQLIFEEKDNLQIHDKFSLLLLNDNVDNALSEMFSLCNPGQGSQFGSLTESQKRRQALWSSKFGEPLESTLGKLEKLNEGKQTPLLEALWSISRRYDFGRKVGKRKLILVSDMLHYTPEFSQYNGNYTYDKLEDNNYFENIEADLSGVDIQIFYIHRRKVSATQGKHHRKFWREYFQDAGAGKIRYEPPLAD